jgi:hypothetical protein
MNTKQLNIYTPVSCTSVLESLDGCHRVHETGSTVDVGPESLYALEHHRYEVLLVLLGRLVLWGTLSVHGIRLCVLPFRRPE